MMFRLGFGFNLIAIGDVFGSRASLSLKTFFHRWNLSISSSLNFFMKFLSVISM